MNRVKTKSFLQNFNWVGILLLALGAMFLGIGLFVQLIAINPNSINVYVNGVRQPPTDESVRMFRMIFLLTFGLIGLITSCIGAFVFGCAAARRRRAERLRESGMRLIAEAVELESSAVRVNNRRLSRLRCAYNESGTTFVFRSGLLRANPFPYLQNGNVIVYCDTNDMRQYFVDVDESVGVGSRVVEL